MSDKQKINKDFHILLTQEQYEKLRLLSYYSAKTIGDIIRIAVNNIDVKDFNVKGGE